MLRVALALGLSFVCGCFEDPGSVLADTGDGDGDGDPDDGDPGDGDGESTTTGTLLDIPSPGDGDGDATGELLDMPGDGDGDGDGDECPAQTDGCPCAAGVCDATLECSLGICVPSNGEETGGPICPEAELLDVFGGWTYYKVLTVGAMTDGNVAATCSACNLEVPCAGPNDCEYTDDVCAQTNNELTCGAPMLRLADELCGSIPDTCEQLWGVYQYMGHAYNGGSVGYEFGSPSPGNNIADRHALCVASGQR